MRQAATAKTSNEQMNTHALSLMSIAQRAECEFDTNLEHVRAHCRLRPWPGSRTLLDARQCIHEGVNGSHLYTANEFMVTILILTFIGKRLVE